MNTRPTPLLSIGTRLGAVFGVLVALLTALCLIVVLHLRSIRDDAGRLLEESREASLASRLLVLVQTFEEQLEFGADAPAPAVQKSLSSRLDAIRSILASLAGGPRDHVDPSRTEHQVEEIRLLATIETELAAVETAVSDPTRLHGAKLLAQARELAAILAEETHSEAQTANDDLLMHTSAAVTALVIAVAAAAIALCAALWFVWRGVVMPIRDLRDATLRLGQGQFVMPAGATRRRDEIGALSRAFEDMARRVSAAQEDLQQRVATRTRELMRAARFADLGVLAAGVAHEINNPLASIASCAEGLERRVARGEVAPAEQRDYLRTIASEAYRAREITGRLLAMARHDGGANATIDLGRSLRQAELMVRHQFEGSGVRLRIEAPDQGPFVHGDAGAIMQVFVNLIGNARDASPRGGEVIVCVRDEGADGVTIVVEDQGAGVPDELVDKIFDPFFTTKAPGEGTGLGLALVAAIVASHHGRIGVERTAKGGARFVVRLPAPAELAP